MRYINILASFVGLVLAAGRTSPPEGALVVAADGSGKYKTIQDAVDALSSSSSEQSIFIKPGTYKEQVYVKQLNGPLVIYGHTSDTSSYAGNQVVITGSKSQKTETNNDATATLRVWTSNFKLYNVNVVNTFGEGSQALALSANAGDQGYYGCAFKGFQDTVLAQTGAQLYAKSYIEGATDFIFGQKGYITASGRADAANPSYYVLNKCSISAAGGNSVEAGAYSLGRPWGAYARVAFQFCTMSNVIDAAGWSVWNKGDERTGKVEFGEYGNEGAGTSGSRAEFAKKLDAPVKKESVLGSGYASARWVDKAYLS
ncbi:carbohydrate esterase family 8 protein [Zymoseptoria brevis]|uniref:Pectinesterase n=1 Tax=Zymoseptoria brevis TaxID=1047168 RepID=A0A0F4GXE6_9PEZI|nr:carbohydrate esterase family 8 protein [Zymoseptoria brevis]